MADTDTDDVRKRLQSFATDIDEKDVIDFAEEEIQKIEDEEAKNLHRASIMIGALNSERVGQLSSQLDSMEKWLKFGAMAILGFSSVVITIVIAGV